MQKAPGGPINVKNASLSYVLEHTLPQIAAVSIAPDEVLTGRPISATWDGDDLKISHRLLKDAQLYIKPDAPLPRCKQNYKILNSGPDRALAINSSKFLVQFNHAANMSRERVAAHVKSLGDAALLGGMDEAKLVCSMYVVQRVVRVFQRADGEEACETFYICPCKTAYHTGGLCKHTLAFRHLDGDIDILALLSPMVQAVHGH